MIRFNYNTSERFIYVERFGEVKLHDIIVYIKKLTQEYGNLKSLFIIDDVRNSKTEFSKIDYPKIVEEVKSRISKYDNVRQALVVDTPSDTALGVLYERFTNSIPNYYCKTFSTVDAAKDWMMQGSYFDTSIR